MIYFFPVVFVYPTTEEYVQPYMKNAFIYDILIVPGKVHSMIVRAVEIDGFPGMRFLN